MIIGSIGTEHIFKLLSDEEDSVIMKTLGLLRNILSQAADIDYIMGLYGKQIIQASHITLDSVHEPDIKEQVLCMLANIADGIVGKEFIMSSEDVLKKVAGYLVN